MENKMTTQAWKDNDVILMAFREIADDRMSKKMRNSVLNDIASIASNAFRIGYEAALVERGIEAPEKLKLKPEGIVYERIFETIWRIKQHRDM